MSASLYSSFSEQFVASIQILIDALEEDFIKSKKSSFTHSQKCKTDFTKKCFFELCSYLKDNNTEDSEIEKYMNECYLAIFNQTAEKTKNYMNEFEFDSITETDPIKVYYFLIETLYENKLLDDLTLLEAFIKFYFSQDIIKNSEYSLQFLEKVFLKSKLDKDNLINSYGSNGSYSIFKLIYLILKNTSS